jgi:hypothetical protein
MHTFEHGPPGRRVTINYNPDLSGDLFIREGEGGDWAVVRVPAVTVLAFVAYVVRESRKEGYGHCLDGMPDDVVLGLTRGAKDAAG